MFKYSTWVNVLNDLPPLCWLMYSAFQIHTLHKHIHKKHKHTFSNSYMYTNGCICRFSVCMTVYVCMCISICMYSIHVGKYLIPAYTLCMCKWSCFCPQPCEIIWLQQTYVTSYVCCDQMLCYIIFCCVSSAYVVIFSWHFLSICWFSFCPIS